MKILTFSTSNSSSSISRELIYYTTHLVTNAEMIDLRDFDCPIYSPDLEKAKGIPDSIKKLNQKIKNSDALIIGLNEHNGYPPAFFKNILDWLTREKHQFLADKRIILISSSPGKAGGASSLKAMEATLPVFGAKIVSASSVGLFSEVFKDGQLVDNHLKTQLTKAIEKLSQD